MPDWKSEIRRRVADLRIDPAREASIVEELAQHLADRYQDLVVGGAPPAEAERRTLAELNDHNALTRGLRRVERQTNQEPVVFGTNKRSHMIADLWQDLRYGARTSMKSPVVTAVVILSLTLGIAANTTIFSVVNTLLLAPPPVDRPDELWQVWRVNLRGASGLDRYKVTTYPGLQFLREHQQSFRALGAMRVEPESVTWNRDGDGASLQCLTVSGDYFELCGVRPAQGRTFLPDEDRLSDARSVAVISNAFWKNKLGADPGVVGKALTINGTPLTVVGVAPPGFTGAIGVIAPEIWIPYAISAAVFRDANRVVSHDYNSSIGLGRLKPGVTPAQAEAELYALTRRLEEIDPKNYKDAAAGLLPSLATPAQARGMIAGFTGIMMAAVFFVLLVACANAANLLLARAASRRSEIAMRAALGANRGRLARQLLTESVLLAMLGGASGVLLTVWLTKLIAQLMPAALPMRLSLALDWRVCGFAVCVSLLTGLIFGLAPAWRSSRVDLTEAIKSSGREGPARSSRLARALIVAQMAVCLILLVAGALCLRSLIKAESLNPGFRVEERVVAEVNLHDYGYSDAQSEAFYARLLERLGATPGVRSASLTNCLPLGTEHNAMRVRPEGTSAQSEDGGILAAAYDVAPGYFNTMGTSLLRGREFTGGDRAGSPLVAVLNETAAARFWPGASPLGRRLVIDAKTGETVEIVGVVQNGKYRSLGEEPRPAIFMSFHQRPGSRATLIAHVSGDPQSVLAALRLATKEIDPRLALNHTETMGQYLLFALFPMRVSAVLLGALGAAALLLAASGLFGVIAYSVARRTREVGVRMALGARPGQIARQIVGEGLRLAAWGIALGIVGALGLTRLLNGLLFNTSATDPLTFTAVSVILFSVAALACWIPARRATRVDPSVALRSE
jgi:predicted permease